MDEVSAPATYEELYQNYYGWVVGLVRKLGIEPQNAEDVAQQILLRFWERDVIAMFDEKMIFSHRGSRRPARFKSFLSAHVERYVRGHRERQEKFKYREPVVCDQPVGDGTSTWIAVFGPPTEDTALAQSAAEASELAVSIYQYLCRLPAPAMSVDVLGYQAKLGYAPPATRAPGARSSQDVMDLPRLFRMVTHQVRMDGTITARELEKAFGVSNTAIHSWLRFLREHVVDFMDEDRRQREEAAARRDAELGRLLSGLVQQCNEYPTFRALAKAQAPDVHDAHLYKVWSAA